jgi:hypothetical protein
LPRPTSDPRGLDEPLAVDHEIVVFGDERATERADLAPVVDGEDALAPAPQRHGNRAPDAFDQFDQFDEALFDEPVDLCIGMAAADVGDGRHVVDDVA